MTPELRRAIEELLSDPRIQNAGWWLPGEIAAKLQMLKVAYYSEIETHE